MSTQIQGVAVAGIGSALPSRVVTNAEVGLRAGVDPAWIESRTGIRERRVAAAGESTSSLGVIAGYQALVSAAVAPADIDLIVVATCTPDHPFPSTASIIQGELGSRASAYDLNAACSGFVYAMATASGQIASGLSEKALVIGADTLSKYTDPTDPVTAPLFGDGAGAVVLQRDPLAEPMRFVLGCDGAGRPHLVIPAGGSRTPASRDTIDRGQHFIRMAGGEVYRSAVRAMTDLGRRLGADDCDLLIGHQANRRILEECAAQLQLSPEQVFINIENVGNTSAASIPIALDEARARSLLSDGDKVVLVSFGAGYTWAGASLVWSMAHPESDLSSLASSRVGVGL